MIRRADRTFVGIWRGNREFTELWRGGRLLWRKPSEDSPPAPGRKVASIKLAAANQADFAVAEFTRHYIKRGATGSLWANIGGEGHSLSGESAPLKTSTFTVSKCQTGTIALDSNSSVKEGDLAVGDTITVTAALAGNHDASAIQYNEEKGLIQAPFWCPLVDSRILIEIQFWGYAGSSTPLTGTATVAPGSATTDIKSSVAVSKAVQLSRNLIWKAFAVNFTKEQINKFCVSGLNSGTPYVRAYLNPASLVTGFQTAPSGSISMEWGWNDYSLNLSFIITEIEYAD